MLFQGIPEALQGFSWGFSNVLRDFSGVPGVFKVLQACSCSFRGITGSFRDCMGAPGDLGLFPEVSGAFLQRFSGLFQRLSSGLSRSLNGLRDVPGRSREFFFSKLSFNLI